MDHKLQPSINPRNLISIVPIDEIGKGNESAKKQKVKELQTFIHRLKTSITSIEKADNRDGCRKYKDTLDKLEQSLPKLSSDDQLRKIEMSLKTVEKKVNKAKGTNNVLPYNSDFIDLTEDDLKIPKNEEKPSVFNITNEIPLNNSHKSSTTSNEQNLEYHEPHLDRTSTGNESKRSPTNESNQCKPIVDLNDLLRSIKASNASDKKAPVEENAPDRSLPNVKFDPAKIREALIIATRTDPVKEYEEKVKSSCFGTLFGSQVDCKPPYPLSAPSNSSVPLGRLSDTLEKLMNSGSESRPLSPPRSPLPTRSPSPPSLVAALPHVSPPHLFPAMSPPRLLPAPCPVPVPTHRPVPPSVIPSLVNGQVKVPTSFPGMGVPKPTKIIPPSTPFVNDQSIEKPSQVIRHPLSTKSNVQDRPSSRPKISQPESKGGVRNKLEQEIMQLHRAGDSNKIRGSLKILKSNLKPNVSSPSSESVSPQTRENSQSPHIPIAKAAVEQPIPSLLTMKVTRPVSEKVASISHDSGSKKPKTLPTEHPVAANYHSNSIPNKNVPKFSHGQNNVKKFETKNKLNASSLGRRPYPKGSVKNQRKDIENGVDNTKLNKESTEFSSPLLNLYPETNSTSSKQSYGHKKFTQSFKIPKKHQTSNKNDSCQDSFSQIFSRKIPFNETQSKDVEKNRKAVPQTARDSTQNSTASSIDSAASDSTLPVTKKKSRKRKRTMTRIIDDDENDNPYDDAGNLKEAEVPVSEETENLFEDNLVQDDAIENVKISDTVASENASVKKKSLSDVNGSSDATKSPAVGKLKSQVLSNKKKIEEVVTKSPRPTPPQNVVSTPRLRASSDETDEMPLPIKSLDKTPVSAKSLDKTPVPAESKEKTPVPAESIEKTSVPAKSFDITPAPAKPSDQIPQDVPQKPVVMKRKLNSSSNTAAKRKKKVSECEKDGETPISGAVTKTDDCISDNNPASPIVIEIELDEPEPTTIMADKKSSKENVSSEQNNSSSLEAKSFRELKSAESRTSYSTPKQVPAKSEQKFIISEQKPILKSKPTIPEPKPTSSEPPSPSSPKTSAAELKTNPDEGPTNDELIRMVRMLKPEQVKLVEKVLKVTSEGSAIENIDTLLDEKSKGEKPSEVSSTTPCFPELNSEESIGSTPFGPTLNSEEADIPASVPSTTSSKKSKTSSKSRKALKKSQKASLKSLEASSKSLKSSPQSQPTSSSFKASPPNSPKMKARKSKFSRELDRLHADIKLMKHTKNNIFTAVGPRACRKQIPMYNDCGQRVESVILPPSQVPKVPCEDWSSSSDDDIFRPTNRESRSNRKNNSHMFSSSSDSAEINSSDDEGVPALNLKQARGRSTSVRRGRSRSSNYKNSNKSRSRSQSYKKAKQDLCLSSSEDDVKKPTEECLLDAETSESKSTSTPYNQGKAAESAKINTKSAVNDVPSSKTKLTICLDRIDETEYGKSLMKNKVLDEKEATSNEDTVDSSFSENNVWVVDSGIKSADNSDDEPIADAKSGEQVINHDYPLMQKIKLKKVPCQEMANKQPLTMKLKKKKKSQKIASKLFPKKSKYAVLSANERISLLPERNSFADDVSSIKIASIVIEFRGDKLLYKCTTDTCNLDEYNSYDAIMFASHLSFSHGNVEWNGRCELCDQRNPKTDLIDALAHLMKDHLTLVDEISASTSSSKIAANSISVPEEKAAKKICTSNTSFAVSEDDFVSTGTERTVANNPSTITVSAVLENNSVSGMIETVAVTETLKNSSSKVPEVDLASIPKEQVAVEENVKKNSSNKVPEVDVASIPKEQVAVEENAEKNSSNKVPEVDVASIPKEQVAVEENVKKNSSNKVPEVDLALIPKEQVAIEENVKKNSSNKVPEADSTSMPKEPVAVEEPKKSILYGILRDNSAPILKEVAAVESAENMLTMTIVSVETVQAKSVVEKKSTKRAVARKRTTGPISLKTIKAKSLLQNTSTPKLPDDLPVIECVERASLGPVSNDVPTSTTVDEKEPPKITTSSMSTETSAEKPTIQSTSSPPVQIENISVKTIISDATHVTPTEAVPVPERVRSCSVTSEADEVTELFPKSAEKGKSTTINAILKSQKESSETDSDTSKPRIRVRRLSGDKLSGSCPVSDSESGNSRRASTENIVSGLEPMQSKKQFIPVILDVKTMPQHNESKSPSSKASQAEAFTAVSSSSIVTTQSVPSYATSSCSTLKAATQSVPSDTTSNSSAFKSTVQSVLSGAATKFFTSNNKISVTERLSADELMENRKVYFYKCNSCNFTTHDSSSFHIHLNNFHANKKKRGRKTDLNHLNCIYCSLSCKNAEKLITHMDGAHGYSNYQCPYCYYRACRPVYVLWHLKSYHFNEEKKILVSKLEDNCEKLKPDKKDQLTVDSVVPGYTCAYGCRPTEFFTYSTYEFTEHMKNNHEGLSPLKCPICGAPCFKLEMLLKHLNLHNFAEYQCIYCDKGFSSKETIQTHLAVLHHSSFPRYVHRACTAEELSKGDYVVEDFDEPFENFRQLFKVVGENVTAGNSTNDNDHPASSSTKNLSLSGNNVIASSPSSTSSDCDLNSNTMAAIIPQRSGNAAYLNANSVARSRAANMIMSLSGKELYRCGMTGCSVAVDDYYAFKEHTNTCDNARNTKSLTCVHCGRPFMKNEKFFDHMAVHSMPRYYCSLCDFKHTLSPKVKDHMKAHKVLKTKCVPADSLRDNQFRDIFFIVPDLDKKSRGPSKATKGSTAVTSRPEPVSPAPMTVTQPTSIPQVTTVYSQEDVELQLSSHTYNDPIKCGICDYSSKVRTNILYHMKSHSSGLGPTHKDIVNPVPQMKKTDLMFNKMTNHAAYSAKNGEKKDIVESKIENSDKNNDYHIPAFVAKIYRFSCGAPECTYITHDSIGLKKHFETLHSELKEFRCPHCRREIPLAKMNAHFRYHNAKLYQCGYCSYLHYQNTRIEDHQREKHPGKDISVVKLRALETDENAENEIRFSALKNDENPIYSSERWRCNLCKYPYTPSEILMKTHCKASHGVANQYKCSMCTFAADEDEIVASHLKSSHSGSSEIIVNIYKKMNTEESLNTFNSSLRPDVVSPSTERRISELPNMPSLSSSSSPFDSAATTEKKPSVEVEAGIENTCSALTTDRTASEEEDDRNNLLVSPHSAFLYQCPLCEDFKTPNEDKMRDHIFAEQKYPKFVCTACGKTGVSRHELEPHLVEERITHPRTNYDYFETFTVDEALENRVQRALAHQTSLMKEMIQENPSKIPVIEISDDEDEEVDAEKSATNAVDSSPSTSNTPDSTRGSKRSYNRKSRRSNNASRAQCRTNIVQSPRGCAQWTSNYSTSPKNNHKSVAQPSPRANTSTVNIPSVSVTCPSCDSVFNSVTVAQAHSIICRRRTSADVSTTIKTSDTSTGSVDACRRRSSPDHQSPSESRRQSAEVSSRAVSGAAALSYCDICGSVGQPMSARNLEAHRRREHDLYTCIRCCGQFAGEDRLINHIHTAQAFGSIKQTNSVCAPMAGADVRMLCTYCVHGECGNDYDTFVSVMRHIRSEHPGVVSSSSHREESEVEVQLRSGKRRPLTSCEISYMQWWSKSNPLAGEGPDGDSVASAAQTAAPPPPVKRRRVAIKSTARPTAREGELHRLLSASGHKGQN